MTYHVHAESAKLLVKEWISDIVLETWAAEGHGHGQQTLTVFLVYVYRGPESGWKTMFAGKKGTIGETAQYLQKFVIHGGVRRRFDVAPAVL